MVPTFSIPQLFVQSQILGHPARHGSYRLEENGMTLKYNVRLSLKNIIQPPEMLVAIQLRSKTRNLIDATSNSWYKQRSGHFLQGDIKYT